MTEGIEANGENNTPGSSPASEDGEWIQGNTSGSVVRYAMECTRPNAWTTSALYFCIGALAKDAGWRWFTVVLVGAGMWWLVFPVWVWWTARRSTPLPLPNRGPLPPAPPPGPSNIIVRSSNPLPMPTEVDTQ